MATFQKKLFALSVCVLVPLMLPASPAGSRVIQGQVLVQESGPSMRIDASDGAIIDWTFFSVLPGEKVSVVLPEASSRLLMRVTGVSPSEISGDLISNGQLCMINQNGIVVDASAHIACDALVMSTLGLHNEWFASGETAMFRNTSKQTVVNRGLIECEHNLSLIGACVENLSCVRSRSGGVCFAAGDEVLLVNDLPRVAASLPLASSLCAVHNTGTIEAQSVHIRSHGHIPEAKALIHEGHIRASGGGESVVLYCDSGTIVDSGRITAPGGNIAISAQQVVLNDSAYIDTSAPLGGGSISIGGAYNQDGVGITAKEVIVSRGAVLVASATKEGDGGTITVESAVMTECVGRFESQGAGAHGHGGDVNISSRQDLVYDGVAAVQADQGSPGHVNLQPKLPAVFS